MGRIDFQQRNMRLSYRKRGKVPRTQIKLKARKTRPKEVIRKEDCRVSLESREHKKRIDRYSDRNKTTKPEPENSTL